MKGLSDPVEKRNAGYRAADLVEDQMVLGLGTGSTVEFFLERLGKRVREGLTIEGIPTSFRTAFCAREQGIRCTSLDDHPAIDLAVDGADQVDPLLRLIKGRGAALAREKCVIDAAAAVLIVVDSGKLSPQLDIPVPIEVLPFAATLVAVHLRDMGATPCLREGGKKDGPVVTDNGNFIIDCDFGPIEDPGALEARIEQLPGVVSCGIFSGYQGKIRLVVGEKTGARILPL